MNSISDIGHDLVAARRTGGISQRALGQLIGVAQPQIARWEASAYRTASLERVAEIADALGYEVAPCHAADLPYAAETRAAYGSMLPGADLQALDALEKLRTPPSVIAAFARSHGIQRLELFGSVLTARFGRESDVDVLVTYLGDRIPSLLALADQETELAAILRRPVDLVSRTGVETGSSAVKKRILETARVLYART